MSEIQPAKDTASLDHEIAEMYLSGKTLEEIAKRMNLATSSCGRRLGKMFKSGEIPRKPRPSVSPSTEGYDGWMEKEVD